MKERRYVKLRVDMYEDTKFKIIDMKPERDTIFYIWSRLVLLAGKVNLGGELYLSKSIPYTIETLSIEFNRDIAQVKLAIDTFIQLEMLELTDGNGYKVKNFAKHQNIKAKENEITDDKAAKSNTATTLSEASELKIANEKDKESENKLVESSSENCVASIAENLETNNTTTDLTKDSMQNSGTILLNTEKNKRCTKNRNKNKQDNLVNINSKVEEISDGDAVADDVCGFTEGELILGKDESVVEAWSFG